MEPKLILTIVLVCLMLAIGSFIFTFVYATTAESFEQKGSIITVTKNPPNTFNVVFGADPHIGLAEAVPAALTGCPGVAYQFQTVIDDLNTTDWDLIFWCGDLVTSCPPYGNIDDQKREFSELDKQ
jgi:hypothetical protein